MQHSEGFKEEVGRQLAGIADVLKCIADEAGGATGAEIEKARGLLARLAEKSGARFAADPIDCAATGSSRVSTASPYSAPTKVITRQVTLTSFTNIEIDCAFIFRIVAAQSCNVAITASESLLDCTSVAQTGDTLKLSLKPAKFLARPIIEARITMPVLSKLRQSAATRGSVSGFQSLEPLDIYLSGSSVLDVDMETGDVRLEISGASRLTGSLNSQKMDLMLSGASRADLRGSARSVVLGAWGAAELDLGALEANQATVYLKGASRATINVTGRLDVDLTGASRLDYVGQPEIHEMDVSGASILGRSDLPSTGC